MSYGVNDMRDGVNLSRMQVTRPLVMHTEVTNLPNLSGFLRFGRNLPVVRFEDSFNTVPTIADGFVERVAPPHRDTDGKALIETIHAEAEPKAGSSRPRRRRTASENAPGMFDGVNAASSAPQSASASSSSEPVVAAPFSK